MSVSDQTNVTGNRTARDDQPDIAAKWPSLECSDCNRQVPRQATFCPWCGERRQRCDTCVWADDKRSWQFCVECGAERGQKPAVDDGPRVRFDHVVSWAEVETEWVCTAHARATCERCPPRPVLAGRRPDQIRWRRVDGRWHCEAHAEVGCGTCLNRSSGLFDANDDSAAPWSFVGGWRCDTHDEADCKRCSGLGYFLHSLPSFRWRDGERRCRLHNQVDCRVCPAERLDESLGQLVDDTGEFPAIQIAAPRAGDATDSSATESDGDVPPNTLSGPPPTQKTESGSRNRLESRDRLGRRSSPQQSKTTRRH